MLSLKGMISWCSRQHWKLSVAMRNKKMEKKRSKGNPRNLDEAGNIYWYPASTRILFKEKNNKGNPSYGDGWKDITRNCMDCFLPGERPKPERAKPSSHQEPGGIKGDQFLVQPGLPCPFEPPTLQDFHSHARVRDGTTTMPPCPHLACMEDDTELLLPGLQCKAEKREGVLHAFKHRDYRYCHCLGLPTNNASSWVIYSRCIIFDGWREEKLFSAFENHCRYKVQEWYLVPILKPIPETADKLPEDGVCNTQS